MDMEYSMPGAWFEGESARRISASIVAICGDAQAERAAQEAATMAGARISAMLPFDDAGDRLAMQAALDVVLIDAAGIAMGTLETVLDAAAHCAEATGAQIVAIFTPAQIDIVAARLFGLGAHLLCEPSLPERVSALAIAGQRHPLAFHDAARESETARLARLNEEVARIAETLSRLTRGDESDGARGVATRVAAYDPPPVAGPTHEREVDAARVRDVIRVRRLRDRFFGEEMFADPAWDMLLDLFAAELEDSRVSVSSLCIAAAVPPTTALRWITNMTEAGLLEREADPGDRRRAFIVLTPKASRAMREYFTALGTVAIGRMSTATQ